MTGGMERGNNELFGTLTSVFAESTVTDASSSPSLSIRKERWNVKRKTERNTRKEFNESRKGKEKEPREISLELFEHLGHVSIINLNDDGWKYLLVVRMWRRRKDGSERKR